MSLSQGIREFIGRNILRPYISFGQFHRRAVHHAVEVDGSESAVFQIIAFAGIGVAVFKNALHDELVETAVAHDAVFVLFEIGFFVGREINRLLFGETVFLASEF